MQQFGWALMGGDDRPVGVICGAAFFLYLLAIPKLDKIMLLMANELRHGKTYNVRA